MSTQSQQSLAGDSSQEGAAKLATARQEVASAHGKRERLRKEEAGEKEASLNEGKPRLQATSNRVRRRSVVLIWLLMAKSGFQPSSESG
ncbi:MAG: hypothetical protein OXI38_03405 [Bacteroidota bacterium]|nr:hypothetical protein [Bacteroidota bacterium]